MRNPPKQAGDPCAAVPATAAGVHAVTSDSTKPLQDSVLYPGGAWEHSHPDRIAANARMYGIDTNPVERCRVLELGCGAGGNLVPMAYGLPDGEFLGIELAARPVEQARRLAASLGLANVELLQCDIQDVPADLGEFDAIIAHGVYSWVPATVREALMAILARHLAPAGIAYLNFNTYPGGHLRALARDIMQFRLASFGDPEARGRDALRFVERVLDAQPEESPYGQVLEAELERLARVPISVVHHDDLLPEHQAFQFRHVVQHAARHGLQYLCEARPADVNPRRYPKRVRAAIRRFGGDRVAREQYFDFLVCQAYRCSLFCRDTVALSPPGELKEISGLRAASSLMPATGTVDMTDGIVVTFRSPDGWTTSIDDSTAKAALGILAARWPASVEVEPLLREARRRAGRTGRTTPLEGREFVDFLASNHALGLVDVHTWEPAMTVPVSDRPVASALARFEIASGTRVTSQRHRQVHVDDAIAVALLPCLDGTRDRAALLARVVQACPDASVSGEDIEMTLAGLAHHCLLQG